MISNNKIIGFGGGFCAGKTTACKILTDEFKFEEMNFADKLKDLSKDLFDMKVKDRGLLQKFGIALRDIDENVWVNYLWKKIDILNFKRVGIGDVRFQNEIEMCKNNNILTIFIDAPLEERAMRHKLLYGYEPTEEQKQHISESIDKNLFDIVLNNPSKEEMKHELKQIVSEFLKDEKLFLKYNLEFDIDVNIFESITKIDPTKKNDLLTFLSRSFNSEMGIKIKSIEKDKTNENTTI